jgi:uncharacterized membrane protein
MTYYLIAEHPEMQFNEALQQSWKIMDGKKMELFVLHLRFIPWYLLGLLFFVVGIFIVVPWHNLAIANYYQSIKIPVSEDSRRTN